MRIHIFQPNITHRGASNTNLVQEEPLWHDAGDAQDVLITYQIFNVTSTPTLSIQTSPTKDDSLFKTMDNMSLLTLTPGTVTLAKNLLVSVPAVPLARWVRFLLVAPAATWDVTWRLILHLN